MCKSLWNNDITKTKIAQSASALYLHHITFKLIRTSPVRPYERAITNIVFASLQILSSFNIDFSCSCKSNKCRFKSNKRKVIDQKHIHIKNLILWLNEITRYTENVHILPLLCGLTLEPKQCTTISLEASHNSALLDIFICKENMWSKQTISSFNLNCNPF